jgi:hypothetical protein
MKMPRFGGYETDRESSARPTGPVLWK